MPSLLLVEDDPLLRRSLAGLLASRGHRVAEAGTLAEAERAVSRARPDAVVLDLGLPDGDGLDLLAAVDPECVLVMSARVDAAERAERAGVRVLRKPVNLDGVIREIERIAQPPSSSRYPRALVCALAALAAGAGAEASLAAPPDHPVITEVFQDPPGLTDGPVGRPPGNLHQSFIEIWLPTAAALRPGLAKDSLDLTFYEVEGDSSSTGLGLVNYRIDLPTFDLDPSNGQTGVPRPASGVVVLGWVDYVGNPPVGLAGTPSTRLGLVNGGILSAPGYSFIALNGAQFGGTTNFPVPLALSLINMPGEATSAIEQNGSGVYLLVDRDSPGYRVLYDDEDPSFVPPLSNANPSLPTGTVLGTSALLDCWAVNDDGDFDVLDQPLVPPTGLDVDLETVLPAGGAFSLLCPQSVGAPGHERVFLDTIAKTTENTLPDDPVQDALSAYVPHVLDGPLGFPSPGLAHFAASPPALACGSDAIQVFDVLTGTTGRPGMRCANEGGSFAMQASAVPGAPSNPLAFVLAAGDPGLTSGGYTPLYPQVRASAVAGVAPGTLANASVAVNAAKLVPTDPDVRNPNDTLLATFRAIDPQTGLDAAGLPFQATALLALQGLPPQPGLANELFASTLATFVAANTGGAAGDTLGNGVALLAAATDLGDPLLVDLMELDLPDLPANYIEVLSPAGLESLVATVLTSAETVSGPGSYALSFDASLLRVRAIGLAIPETRTSGGKFTPQERVHYANAAGLAGDPASGLSHVDTTRGFELALVDTNVQQLGTLETGATDDFGLVVEIGRTAPGAAVVPGQFVFLSFTGGLEGADIDSLDVPPGGNRTVLGYLDLDRLDALLGAQTIRRLFVVDGSGSSAVNVMEAFSLHRDAATPRCGDANADGFVLGTDVATLRGSLADPLGQPLSATGQARCNVTGAASPACDLLDVVVESRALAAPRRGPGLTQSCPGGGA